jgi:PKD repeat protein
MKITGSLMSNFRKYYSLLLVILLSGYQGIANNPKMSNYLTNLSMPVNTEAVDDVVPEMVIEGNTIHVVWMENKYGVENPFYYCRSTDLGKTWETPKLIAKLKDGEYARQAKSRKLAIDGNNVHIAFCDYNYSNNGTGRIYYLRSTNGGSSFETVKELASTGGGYQKIYGSQIKAKNGKVAIAYMGTGTISGLRMLASTNNGTAFTDQLISIEPSEFTDFWYDGTQMIVVSEYIYYYYGLNVGKVFVSISNDNGTTFTTQKVSITYNESPTAVRERCRCYFDGHYAPKIAKSGNNIHVVFVGYNEKIEWTTLYARSTDNGLTFEKAKDINNAILTGAGLQAAMETVAAKNGHVYMAYQSTGGKIFFLQSADNGNTISTAKSILPDGVDYAGSTWYPSLVIDQKDTNGTTFYVTGQSMFSVKSSDGGNLFSQSIVGAPFLNRNISSIISDMAIDSKGGKHWISEAKWWYGSDRDIFYKNLSDQPAPGTKNKALAIETVYSPQKVELVIVPSSQSLDFDSAMTAEAWVKFDPKSENEVNVLAKVNGADAYDYAPNGYQLGFRKSNGKFYANSGLETDKGDFVNWGTTTIADTLWHHVAFTYDAKAGLNNFKTYVDGLLSIQQTVTGKIIQKNGLLMIGSRSAFYGTTKYQVDNIRLWNKALSQDELLKNQVKTLTGTEAGLKMFLNFDDTFKDISGNGNDAIPLYLGILKNSDFSPPVPAFDLYQTMNQISLTNKTQNGKTYNWSYGEGTVSTLGNPVYTYPKAGEYSITLEAMNANSKTATIKKATIAGLNRVEPLQAGNGGYATISVFGGGLVVEGTTVFLRKTGESDIPGEKLALPTKGVLLAYFNLNGKTMGKWDFVVKKGGIEQVLKETFSIIKAEPPAPWLSVSGRGAILFNMWQTYTISYGNNGNVDALGVPLNIAIQNYPETEVELIDFIIAPSTYIKTKFPALVTARTKDYFIWKDYFGTGKDARIYSLIVPMIPAGSSDNVHIRIKSPDSFNIESWMNAPFYKTDQTKSAGSTTNDWPDEKTKLNACVAAAAMDAASSGAADLIGMVLPIGCAYDVLTYAWNPWDAVSPKPDKPKSFWDHVYGLSSCVISCGASFTGAEAILKGGMLVKTMIEGYQKNKECHELYDPLYKNKMGVRAVSSFDPNEMIGPAGFGDNHWIQKNNAMPYTVLFENKSTASAPAHIVTVTNTLDLTKFDLKEFGFGSFGFGDTILSPSGKKLRQFSMDVSLKPKMNLTARVSGKIDTITGVIKWEFLSLNPTTMQFEEDPFIGFLPPNNANHAGEGFVSYSVGLKKELGTNAVLKNKASIVFDANNPIITNEFVNTLDLDQPQSQVYPLNATIDSRFPLSWTGSDVGSGIASYSVYVMENDTALRPWKLNTTLKSAEFIGNVNSKYKFYSVATDNVSLKEAAPSQYDASTHITVDVKEFELKKDELQVFPNPVKDKLNISLQNAPCGMYVVELVGITGQVYYSEIHDDFSISKGIQIDVNGLHSGNYMVRMVFGNKLMTRKIMIK